MRQHIAEQTRPSDLPRVIHFSKAVASILFLLMKTSLVSLLDAFSRSSVLRLNPFSTAVTAFS